MNEKYSESDSSRIGEETSLLSKNNKKCTQIIEIGKIVTNDVPETPNITLSSKDGNEFLIISAQEYQRFIKETKSYKVVTTLDILFAMFIVTPAVVGFWRGSWVLMDKYPAYFPPWGVCAFSTVLQLGFTIYRRNFINFSERCRNTKYCSSFAQLGMIFYNYAFANLSIMNWRALWQIIDRHTNVMNTRDGRVLPDHSRTVLMVSMICLLLIAAMKCVRNTSAVPFGIARDTVECTYDFPTRYKIEVLYIVMISMKTTYVSAKPIQIEDEDTETIADRMAYAESRKAVRTKKPPPQPFANIYNGPSPSEFTPATRRTTTLKYPQLNEYRHRVYPKSIQDIIAYMTVQEKQTRRPPHNKYRDDYREPQGQELYEQRHNDSGGFQHGGSDPFYPYKPQDPSDINLLATGNLRFAPPIWKNLRKKPSKQRQPQEENSDRDEVFNESKVLRKPVVISLSIFPFDSEIKRPGQSRYGRRKVPYRIRAYVPSKNNGNHREDVEQETMIIHLNVFPSDMLISEDAQESRLRGHFVGFIKDSKL